MKQTIAIIGCLIFAFILVSGFRSCHENHKLRTELAELANNARIISDSIKHTKTKSGDVVASKGVIIVQSDELKHINQKLVADIKSMELKIKKLSSVSNVNTEYVYINDTIYVVGATTDSVHYRIKFADSTFINIDQMVVVDRDKNIIYLDSIGINLSVNYMIATENKYKGFWFWRKVVGSDIHIKSDNPYVKTTDIYSVQFK